MNRRAFLTGAAALTAGRVLSCATPAAAMGLVEGTGWDTQTVVINGVTYRTNALVHNQHFTITFGNAASRTTLKPYALVAARALNVIPALVNSGIHFDVPDTIETLKEPAGAVYPCAAPAMFHINMTLRKGAGTGMSWTNTCVLNSRFAWGGDIWIDPEYFTNAHWFTTNSALNTLMIHNTISHEIGHAIGLAHPILATKQNGHPVPLMHGSNGPGKLPTNGYQSTANQGKFTYYESIAFNTMVANGA